MVVLRDPEYKGYAIKRIVAKPGDSVYVKGGQIFVNGSLLREPYLVEKSGTGVQASACHASSPGGMIKRRNMNGPGESGTSGQDNYLFIDNARFVSLIAIVMRHCQLSIFDDDHLSTLENGITQIRSFGVLLFFVNSAFLMAAWLARPNTSVRTYWRGRLDRVGKPWLIWASAFQVCELVIFFSDNEVKVSGLPHQIWHGVFGSNYWFVPILFFSFALILPLRRYWRSWSFGVALLMLSWFYGVNQYGQWVEPSHTTAFFGYLFYLWLGVRLFQNFTAVQAFVQSIPWWFVLLILCSTISLMIVEDQISISHGFPNHYNALQNSNQIYALVVRLARSCINVRKESYGIYLTHQIVAVVGRAGIDFAVGWSVSGESLFTRLPEVVKNPFARVGIWVLWFGFVYTVSLAITKALRHTAWAWTVGEKG